MSKRPLHRGVAPEDGELYDPRHLPALRAAQSDLCWLLDHGYATTSAAELVGNRHQLTSRQRMAVIRCACSAELLQRRRAHQLEPAQVRGEELWLDGFNILLAIEVALSGGVVLLGRDGCYRDVAGIHAHYRKVAETHPALELIGDLTTALGVCHCCWHLDKPVSNSGRLRGIILDVAQKHGWPWSVELDFNPDKTLAESEHVISTADSAILDRCARWVNLVAMVIQQHAPQARVVDLSQV